jgi:catechol 2,3-dioxygenase
MGMTGVLRPGHVQIRVLDLEEAAQFYGNVIGLIETGRDSHGRVYFRAWDEREHSSIILRQADQAGMDFMGWKVDSVATLDKLEADLNAYGTKTERIPAGDLLQTGERVRFEVASGHLMELYAEKSAVKTPQTENNPPPWNPEAERGMGPIRFDHCLLYGPDIEKVQDLFCNVLGFHLSEQIMLEDGKTQLGVFLACSTKAHDVAFIRNEDRGKFHHVSFYLESWEKVLRSADLMSMNKVSIDMGPTRHGVTRGTTIYAFDPSGNRFETFAGVQSSYPDHEPLTWTWEEVGTSVFYHDRQLNPAFLEVYT